MIFVTVGTRPEPFLRLVKAADTLAGWIDEAIVIQQGPAPYAPLHAHGVAWMDAEAFRFHLLSARVVVSHAGAGTILQALNYHKPLVIVPRSSAWKESTDDHQSELAQLLHGRQQAVLIDDVQATTLWDAITFSASRITARRGEPMLQEAVADQLALWNLDTSITHVALRRKGSV